VTDIADVVRRCTEWALFEPRLRAILLVGSQARGTATAASDVDLVIITDHATELHADHAWTRFFGTAERWQAEDWGAVRSLRVWFADGLEMEFGFAAPSWLSEPLDQGTRKVVQHGFGVVYDPTGNVASRLRRALEGNADNP
jgi:hypothetical protein